MDDDKGSYLTFKVKSEDSAYIGLFEKDSEENNVKINLDGKNYYEIKLGSKDDGKSQILRNGKEVSSADFTLKKQEFSEITVAFVDGSIKVSHGHVPEENVWMEWKDPEFLVTQNYSFRTDENHLGEWFISDPHQ